MIGGRDVNDNLITAIDRYNIQTDTWEFVADWVNATSDGVAWGIERDNLLMMAGGYNAIYGTPGTLSSYNVGTSTFSSSYPAMIVGRGDTQVATINNDEFYVIGGWTGDNFVTPSNGKLEMHELPFAAPLTVHYSSLLCIQSLNVIPTAKIHGLK